MIKYIGSKRALITKIIEIIQSLRDVSSVIDPFYGSGRVSTALKENGYTVHAGDYLKFSALAAHTYLQSNLSAGDSQRILKDLQTTKPVDGYVTETYARQARFFSVENAMKIDGCRDLINTYIFSDDVHAYAVTALIEAADKVDSSCGQHAAYLKSYAPRAFNPIKIEPISIPKGPRGSGTHSDARQLLSRVEADLVYLDPPYTHHSYAGMYHIWETIAYGDTPEAYGVARKNGRVRDHRSPFNSKKSACAELITCIDRCQSKYVLLSYSNEGIVPYDTLMSALAPYKVIVHEIPHRRYIGSHIGVHNPQGEKVGVPTHHTCREFLFLIEK